MTKPDEGLIKKFFNVFTDKAAKPIDIQGLIGVTPVEHRPAAIAAVERIPGLAFKICESAVWETKPEEFALSIELLGALKPDQQRTLLVRIVDRLQHSSTVASSRLVRGAVENLRSDMRVLQEVREHTLLTRFLRP